MLDRVQACLPSLAPAEQRVARLCLADPRAFTLLPVVQLADLIQEKTQPDGLAVVMNATHYCMSWRGVKDPDSRMINSVMRGAFLKDANLRREFLSLIRRED